VYFETIGGFSLAKIKISEGDTEIVEGLHVHNGGRLIVALSKSSKVVLPSGTVNLRKNDVIWMPPWTLHSFLTGDFLALHPNEAGWNHPEAFLPYRS